MELKEELNELKSIEEATEKEETTNYADLEFTPLIKTVTKKFSLTSEPICNGVKGWQKETKFYINSACFKKSHNFIIIIFLYNLYKYLSIIILLYI